jgi:hypothetical protein
VVRHQRWHHEIKVMVRFQRWRQEIEGEELQQHVLETCNITQRLMSTCLYAGTLALIDRNFQGFGKELFTDAGARRVCVS